MDSLQSKNLTTSRGMSYHYYTSKPSTYDTSKPTIVLHHGFPDTAHTWSKMLPYLSKLPNRLLIPNLLGYEETSKTTDPKAYAYHLMIKDILEILDAEGIDKVVTLGHDHGVGTASRFWLHAPERTVAVILLNVAYRPPVKGQKFDLAATNAQLTQAFGYPLMEYWNFFTAPDAAEVMGSNLDHVWNFAHPATPEAMQEAMCVPGAARRLVLDGAGEDFPTKPHAKNESIKGPWKKALGQGGLEAPLQWYHAITTGVQGDSDGLIPNENIKISVPTLYIGCEEDIVCRKELIYGPRDAGLLPDLKIEWIEGVGHWPMYEKPEYTAGLISSFITEKGL